jgi:hypothetical protein
VSGKTNQNSVVNAAQSPSPTSQKSPTTQQQQQVSPTKQPIQPLDFQADSFITISLATPIDAGLLNRNSNPEPTVVINNNEPTPTPFIMRQSQVKEKEQQQQQLAEELARKSYFSADDEALHRVSRVRQSDVMREYPHIAKVLD